MGPLAGAQTPFYTVDTTSEFTYGNDSMGELIAAC
jgi:hypothetical protein